MLHFLQKLRSSDIKNVLILCLLLVSFAIVYITSAGNIKRLSLFSRASGTTTLKIMTYNIKSTILDHDDDKSDDWAIDEMRSIAHYIKDHNIEVVALQEVTNGPAKYFKNIENIQEELANIGYPMFSTRHNQVVFPCCEASQFQAFFA